METEIEAPKTIPYRQLVLDHSRVTQAVVTHQYKGTGSKDDPYIVSWIPSDPGNPMAFSKFKKWFFSSIAAVSMLATVFNSSVFIGKP